MLGWLVLLPVIVTSIYAAYCDIFHRPRRQTRSAGRRGNQPGRPGAFLIYTAVSLAYSSASHFTPACEN